MLPLGDDNSTRRTVPIVTYLLIAINIFVFLMELTFGDAFITELSVVPARFFANPSGQWMTIFSAMFMHAGWLHLLGNMLYLWIFGDNVEDLFGHLKFLVFYLATGIAATYAQMLVDPTSTVPNLGASGAIAGVLGAYLLLFPRQRVRVLLFRFIIPMPAVIVIGFWILLQVFSQASSAYASSSGGVAYMAHIGGFIAGFILALVFRRKSRPQLYQ